MQAALALWPLLLFPKALDPKSAFFYRDILGYWVPQVESFVRAIAEGSWLLWDPYMGFGAPMLADANNQAFYPFKWLNLVLSPSTYYKALVLTHTAFAGIGAFRLGRRYGLREWPALAAAGLWVSSGPFLSTVAHHHFVSACWITWVMIGVESVLEAPSPINAARLGLAAAAMLLGGSGDVGLMTVMAACLRGVTHLVLQRPPLSVGLRLARSAGLAALLAFGVASAQWIPTLAQVRGSGRAGMAPETRAYWSLSPLAALDLVFPRLIADAPLSPSGRARVFEAREPFLTCLYVGVIGLPLVVLGGLSQGAPRAWLLLGLLLFFALALGRSNPAYAELARLPPFSLLRYPVKYLLPFTLCFCLLAGRGLQAWLEPSARRWPVLVALAAALGLALVSGAACWSFSSGGAATPALFAPLIAPTPEARASFAAQALRAFAATFALGMAVSALLLLRLRSDRSARWTALAAGLLAVADTARVGRTIDPLGPAALLQHVPPLVARLRGAREELRVFALPAEREWMISQLARGPAAWDAEARWSLGLLELLQPPAGARWGIFGSYDGDFTGLAPAAAGELRSLVMVFKDTPSGVRLLRLGNVGYVVALGRSGFSQLEEAATPLYSVFREPIRLLGVPRPLPRFYVVDRSRVASEPASYASLAEPAFEPEREIILAPPAAEARGVASFTGSLRLLERRMNRLSLEADLTSDGFAVLVEAWDAGWRAWVDGRPAPVLRANVLFRAVPVPAGRHRVELAYRPPAAAWGLLIGAASLAVAIAFAARRR